MKKILLMFLVCIIYNTVFGQQIETKKLKNAGTKEIQIVEAACGQCQFKLPGKSCDLAVRINGKAYFVDGANIDEHGDAHGTDGFCNAISKAEVKGEIVDGRYKATYFKLIKSKKEK